MNNYVKLYRNGGFYSCFEESAFVLHALFGYKIINSKVGFPIKSYEKVINKLEELNISYQNVADNISKDFGNDNSFLTYLEQGKKKFDYNYRIDRILDKLDNLNEEDIDNIINSIEEVIK